MARITVLGGTGYAGSHIAREAAARGHEVVSISRTAPETPTEGVEYRTGDLLDSAFVAGAIEGADVIVSALSPRGALDGKQVALLADVAARAQQAGSRFGVIGGAGSLLVAEGGAKVIDSGFPEEIKPEAQQLDDVLEALRASDEQLDWFFVSPAGGFGAWAPGERTGTFRVGGDVLLTDADGVSFIGGDDFAIAIVDEIERPAHSRGRFTVAY